MRGSRISIAAAVAALCASGIVVASAATLGPVSSGIFSAEGAVTHAQAARSASDVELITVGSPATVTGIAVTVIGSGLSGLDGQDITVALLDSSGIQLRTITATLASATNLTVGASSATVSLPVSGAPLKSSFASWAVFIAGVQALGPAADPTMRVVTIGNGTIAVSTTPVDWKGLVSTQAPYTAITDLTLTTATPTTQCISVTMTGTRSNPELWSLRLAFSAPPFYGVAPTVDAHAVVTSIVGGVMTIVGTDNGTSKYDEWANNSRLSNKRVLTISICQNAAGSPPDQPSAYTVSGQSRGTWTTDQACIERTVTGNGVYPFYFGWSLTMDLTEAIAHLQQADTGAPRSMVAQANTTSPATYTPGVTAYVVTNTRDTAISGTQSRVVTLCVSRS